MPDEDEKVVGAYLLHNQETGYGYVGSSHDLEFRIKTHQGLLKRGKHPNKRLQAQFNANPNFDPVVLPLEDREVAFDFEQCLLDEHATNPFLLNRSRDARYCRVPGLKHSDETKAKIGAASKGNQNRLGSILSAEHRQQISDRMKGHEVSQETRDKIAASKVGLVHSAESNEKNRLAHLGRKATAATLLKMSESMKGKNRTPENLVHMHALHAASRKSVSIDGVTYPSINEAARVLGLNPGFVHGRLNNDSYPTWFYN